jgi:ribosomal protein S18 acetylase RimI-like enzyme
MGSPLVQFYDTEMRVRPPLDPGELVERVDGVVRTRGSHNMVVYAHLKPEDAGWVVAKQAAFFRELGEALEWKLYAHDQPPNLSEALVRQGFEPDERETLMVLELAKDTTGFRSSPEVEVRPVRTPADLETYVTVTQRAFGEQPKSSAADLAPRLFGDGASTLASVAYVDGKPAAAGRLQLPPGRSFASMWGGGTDPALRKRGIYRALVAERARTARDRGYTYLTVDALDTSRPILERLGFIPITTVCAWNLRPRP